MTSADDMPRRDPEGAAGSDRPPGPEEGERRLVGEAPRRELVSWMLFDFANSSFTTIIVTVVFSVYFKRTVVEAAGGSADDGTFYWALGLSLSQVLVLLSAPVVGAIADFSAIKKKLLFVTFVGCVAGTWALAWVGPGDLWLGIAIFMLSNFFFSSGENLIAAFLPEITTPERMGRVSGAGWALGYVGGLLSLVACYPLVSGGFGPGNADSVQRSFVVVAVFFLAGGLPTFLFLRERARPQALPEGQTYVTIGFRRVFETLKRVRDHRQLFRFLGVFLCYNCGIIIVVSFSSIYADQELNMGSQQLMIFFIVVQVSSSLGAFAFGYLQDRTSAKTALNLSLVVWLVVCLGAYVCRTATLFYVIGNLAGIAMGASQSGARALVGTFSPPGRSGEFFGFWGLVWKLSAAVSPYVFSYVNSTLGMRYAVLGTGAFFLVGIVGMTAIDEKEGRREAEVNDE